MVPILIRAISMHKTESKEISNRKIPYKTILACREWQAKKKNADVNVAVTNCFRIYFYMRQVTSEGYCEGD